MALTCACGNEYCSVHRHCFLLFTSENIPYDFVVYDSEEHAQAALLTWGQHAFDAGVTIWKFDRDDGTESSAHARVRRAGMSPNDLPLRRIAARRIVV